MTEEEQNRNPGIYLLPNLLTTTALFAAFYSIVMAVRGEFENAAIAIFIAMIADSLDGRVARLTNTTSEFGAQYDSLSDMVAFAVAPSLIAYTWSLSYLGKLGWLIAFLYTATGALRLARFNVQHSISDRRFFIGLPSPAAAAVVAGIVWLGNHFEINGEEVRWIVASLTLGTGLLMVSNFRYYSFKTIDLKAHVPFVAILIVVLVFIGISVEPPLILMGGFLIYAISGPVYTLRVIYKHHRERITEIHKKHDKK